MTRRVYLHVGAPGSGITPLQGVLRNNSQVLQRHGVLVAGGAWRTRVRAGYVLRDDPRLEQLPASARQAWQRIVTEIGQWSGETAILSYELLAGVSAERAAEAIADLAGAEVHVVFSIRDLATQVGAAWQEALKYRLRAPLDEWEMEDESAGPLSEWSWRTADPVGVLARWGATLPPRQVHVLTVPRSGPDLEELWRRFATACGIGEVPVEFEGVDADPSLGPVSAELLRRLNSELPPDIQGPGPTGRWVRDLLAHRILAAHPDEPLGLPEGQRAEAARRAERARAYIAEQGFDVVGSVAELSVDAGQTAGRAPESVTDQELVDLALQTVARLVDVLRTTTRERDRARAAVLPEPAPATGPVGRFRARARRALSPVFRAGVQHLQQREHERLRARIAQLEEELQQSRHLHHRLAEVSDVVTQLLVPAAERGSLGADEVREYRRTGRDL